MLAVPECPVCGDDKFTSVFSCKDFTVSHETFQLVKCENCDLIITSPRPANEKLGDYYLSDNYISHSNQSTSLIDIIYRISRHFTLKWKYNLIRNHSNKTGALNILDYGCGTGSFLKKCESKGDIVSGVEPSAIARATATEQINGKVTESISEIKHHSDVVTLWHVLEHIPDLNTILEQLHSRLSENGTIFIAVPNHQSADAKRYQQHWAGYDVPRHLWHFSRKNMKTLLDKNNFTLVNISPMKLDAFYVSILSEKYLRNKITPFGLTNALIHGLTSNFQALKTNEYSSLIYIARKK